jgi:hypothetical protein
VGNSLENVHFEEREGDRIPGLEENGSGLGTFPMAGYGINSVVPSVSAAIILLS